MSILSTTLVLINEISSRKNEKSRLLIPKAHLLFNFQGKNRWPVRKESLALPKSPKKRGHNARISILSPILMAGAPTPCRLFEFKCWRILTTPAQWYRCINKMGCDAMWPSQTQNSSFANIVLIVQLQHSTNTSNMKVSMCNKIVFTTIIIATVNAQSGLRTLTQDVSCALFIQSVMVLRTHWNFANLVPNLLYTYIHIALCLSHDEQIRQVQWG